MNVAGNIGRNLTILMYDRKAKTKDLAAAVGVTQGAVSKFKAGTRVPGAETLLKIANYFGVTVDELIR